MSDTCAVIRLRRTTHEDAYVAVPLTDAVMRTEPEPDGTYRIDFEAFVREAVRLSATPGVDWRAEEESVAMHPLQGPVPEGRTVFDVHTE
jgi:hypothetical protein